MQIKIRKVKMLTLIILGLVLIVIGFLMTICEIESGVLPIILGIFTIFFTLFMWPISYYGKQAGIKAFKETQIAYENRHAAFDNIERAAFIQTVVECNQWLAKTKYWNSAMFDWYIPDEVEELERIGIDAEK
jgi:hypothetical protein